MKSKSPVIPRNLTVAIVGTHPNTREKAPYTDPQKDVWIFNNQILQGWVQRADAVFDIHQPEDVYRRGIEHPAFGDWLKGDKRGVKFITPAPMPEIPGNEVYPLDAVIEKLLPHFKRGTEINPYFTSGPAYAIALAIYKGYKRIELYGIEMEANAEYIYQRDGIGLWAGVAIGRGIEFVVPTESILFYAPLYGYGSDATTVDREAFETRATELEIAKETTLAEYNSARGRLNAINENIKRAQELHFTEENMLPLYKEYADATNAWEQAIANYAFVNGQYLDCRAWQARVDKALEYAGKSQAILAQNDQKWGRHADKADLAGGWMMAEGGRRKL